MRYAVMYQWDIHEEQIWPRIMFYEGRFNCFEAQEFLDHHEGLGQASMPADYAPATHFHGPVVATLLLPGRVDAYQQWQIMTFASEQPNNRFLSSYEWALTRHHLTTIFVKSKYYIYALNRPVWDTQVTTFSPSNQA